MDQDHIRHIIPIYEEGTVDEDLLNEGNRRLRDYYQRLGYFDVRVDHQAANRRRRACGDCLRGATLGLRRRVAAR